MEPQEPYSVFDEVPREQPPRKPSAVHRLLYFGFITYFIIHATYQWAYFVAYRRLAFTHATDVPDIGSLPLLLSAITGTAIVVSSIVLYLRKSMRAAIALLILGAVIELLLSFY